MASDAFIVGEDWISEHYFGSDQGKQSMHGRVLALRKNWDAREADGEPTPKSQLTQAKAALLTSLAKLATPLLEGDVSGANRTAAVQLFDREVLDPIASALGYEAAAYVQQTQGPVTWFTPAHSTEAPAAALIKACPVTDVSDLLAKNEHTLLESFAPDGSQSKADTLHSVARTLSWVFGREDAPALALVLAGGLALVTERARWAEGRYLAVDVQLVLDRADAAAVRKKGGEVDRLVAILSAESLLPAIDGSVWWEDTLEESVKHTVGVSQDLRDGVRESIEIIANEVVHRRAAQGLDPLPQAEADTLARQSLRYLYRILFLLYAEASPELGVLPVGAPEYSQGYGLDRLRELVLVDLGEQSRHRTHLYESLATLFRLVDAGSNDSAHSRSSGGSSIDTATPAVADEGLTEGLSFHSLNADLFLPEKTALIDEVGLGDHQLQHVLQLLLLTRESETKRGRDRGFISYADLGINQLGSVYEGLMSYSGFFAEEDLFEVAKDGNPSKGSWVVPVARSEHIPAQHFVLTTDSVTGQRAPRRYRGGEFVYRLSGRARQQSASYYSPEVLTRFVVSQALEELLDQDDTRTTAAEILELSVCEPALGSGAFAIEAVRQLAHEYLTRREHETGERIDPDERPRELQKAKAQIALHQVYGVDLNDTAVELAEISLWLDTMVEGLEAPWFGLRLRRGNSLIGGRRALYTRRQIEAKSWLKDVPSDEPVSGLADEMRAGTIGSATSGRVHHFLLPAQGWGAACEAKEARTLAPDAQKALNAWRRRMRQKPSGAQIKRLTALAHRVETLWQFTLRRLEIAEEHVQREVALWNDPRETESDNSQDRVTRVEVEGFLRDENGAYQRLRRVMDAWCAMWFWPLTDTLTQGVAPPNLDEWVDGLEALLGHHSELKPKQREHGSARLGLPTQWHDLTQAEELDLAFAGSAEIADVLAKYPWLSVTERIAAEQGFFHWELDYAGVFARGGFDLQVGNPPWVRPRSDVDALLAEGDPWWQLAVKPTQAEVKQMREQTLQIEGITEQVVEGTAEVASTAEFVGDVTNYPHLAGLQPDLYRCFMEQAWRNGSSYGVSSLIHPETHFADDRATTLRRESYSRLRRSWHFSNRFLLFEIGAIRPFGVHVYGNPLETPHFLTASSIFTPETVISSLHHDGSGKAPGVKNDAGEWDISPHSSRIIRVDRAVLEGWNQVLGKNTNEDWTSTRMISSVNSEVATATLKLASQSRISGMNPDFSWGWDESVDHKKGRFEISWGQVGSWEDAILQGPHIFVAVPFYKSPNATMKSKGDWHNIDLEMLEEDALPITKYKPQGDRQVYDANYTRWGEGSTSTSARGFFRIAWRRMTDNVGERSLMPAIIPPGAAHVNAMLTLGSPAMGEAELLEIAGVLCSLVSDFGIRSVPKSDIYGSSVARLPFQIQPVLRQALRLRASRLNCVTRSYSSLLKVVDAADSDVWTGGVDYAGRPALNEISREWNFETPLRRDSDRRQALLEIDAIVALSLGITADELCTVYRTQFPVLYGYDRNSYFYDANGRLVPRDVLKVFKQKGESITEEERTAVHPGSGVSYTYELPFITLDREADMRRAYSHFEQILKDQTADASHHDESVQQ